MTLMWYLICLSKVFLKLKDLNVRGIFIITLISVNIKITALVI